MYALLHVYGLKQSRLFQSALVVAQRRRYNEQEAQLSQKDRTCFMSFNMNIFIHQITGSKQ